MLGWFVCPTVSMGTTSKLLAMVWKRLYYDSSGKSTIWLTCITFPLLFAAALTLSPEVASPQGGTRVFISGPCLTEAHTLKVRLGGEEVDASRVSRVSRYRAQVIIPAYFYLGTLDLELSLDDGTTYLPKAVLTLSKYRGFHPRLRHSIKSARLFFVLKQLPCLFTYLKWIDK